MLEIRYGACMKITSIVPVIQHRSVAPDTMIYVQIAPRTEK